MTDKVIAPRVGAVENMVARARSKEIELPSEIEQSWLPLTSLGVVHVLPGRTLPGVARE